MQTKTSCICFSLLSAFSSKRIFVYGDISPRSRSDPLQLPWQHTTGGFQKPGPFRHEYLLPVCHMYRRPKWEGRDWSDSISSRSTSMFSEHSKQMATVCALHILWLHAKHPLMNSKTTTWFFSYTRIWLYGMLLRIRRLPTEREKSFHLVVVPAKQQWSCTQTVTVF